MVEGMGGVGRRRVGAGGGSRREREGKGGGSRGGGAGTASQLRTRRAYVSHPLFAWVSRKLLVLTVQGSQMGPKINPREAILAYFRHIFINILVL